jgi:hypothetical protein
MTACETATATASTKRRGCYRCPAAAGSSTACETATATGTTTATANTTAAARSAAATPATPASGGTAPGMTPLRAGHCGKRRSQRQRCGHR